MLRNYLVASLRSFAANRLYATINIFGLAVGFAAAILIALYVRDEFSYNRWIPGNKNIYIVGLGNVSGAIPESFGGPSDLGSWIKSDLSAVRAVSRVWPDRRSLRHGDIEATEQITWADANIFAVFDFPIVAGDLRTALEQPDGIVLTEAIARKYFGRSDPIGESIELDRQRTMRVTAVREDDPYNTTVRMDIVIPGYSKSSPLVQSDATPMVNFGKKTWSVLTFVQLAPSVQADDVTSIFPDFLDRHAPHDLGKKPSSIFRLRLVPIGELKLHPPGSLEMVYAISWVAVLIVAIATVNFVNLMTARSGRRALEIGIRKACGATRQNLLVQFLGETTAYAAIGMAVALMLTESVLPLLNAFLDRDIALAYSDSSTIVGLAACTLCVGILGGSYPALVLSGLQPVSVLKRKLVGASKQTRTARQILVVLQFAILIALIVTTLVIYRQTAFAMNEGLRVGADQLVRIRTNCQSSFKEEVIKLPGVLGAACSAQSPYEVATAVGVWMDDGRPSSLWYDSIDFGYFELFGQAPLAGRFFHADRGADAMPLDLTANPNEPIVINETAVRRLGFSSPQDAVGRTIKWSQLRQPPGLFAPMHASEVIGVAADYSLGSVRRPIPPTAFYVDQGRFLGLIVKLKGQNVPETLAEIDRLWMQFGEPRPIERGFLDQYVENLYRDITRNVEIFATFSAVVLVIACLGLFGLATFTAESRTKEIGIRKAMGANTADIVRLLAWEFAKPVLWANLIAWPAAYFVMNRWLSGFAYHIDLAPWMFFAAGALALLIAVATISGHSLLVALAKPVAALRYE